LYGRYSWAYETESYCGRKIISLAAYSNGVEVKKSHTNGAAAWQRKKKKSVKKGTQKNYARTGWLRAPNTTNNKTTHHTKKTLRNPIDSEKW